ncbi:DUF3017 domain-containing protein [Rhodococcus aerolatus]
MTGTRHPPRTGGWRVHVPFAVVLLVVLAAFALVATDRWRRGATVLGAALVLAAGLRALLSEERAGLLAVRARIPDVLVYGGLGVALVGLAASIDSLGTG